MIILDTDCLSLLNREKILESSILRQRLDSFAPEEIFTTIITFEEQMRGWLAVIAKAKTPERQIFGYERLHISLEAFGYERLHISLEAYRNTAVLDYDENAANIFKNLKSQKIRIGTMDLKIASIALSRKAILVSRNLKDFENVPNLVVKDWSR
jgi:tRNA(fMet)-specific endonuclease VapC